MSLASGLAKAKPPSIWTTLEKLAKHPRIYTRLTFPRYRTTHTIEGWNRVAGGSTRVDLRNEN